MFVITGMGLQERLALKSALSFMVHLSSLSDDTLYLFEGY